MLGGLISPMDGIGPTDIKVEELVQKVENGNIKEIILTLKHYYGRRYYKFLFV